MTLPGSSCSLEALISWPSLPLFSVSAIRLLVKVLKIQEELQQLLPLRPEQQARAIPQGDHEFPQLGLLRLPHSEHFGAVP